MIIKFQIEHWDQVRHNKSTLHPTFSTPAVKSRRIGYTRPQGLSSEEVYSSKTATST